MSVATIQPDKADQNDLIFDGNKCSFDVKIIGGMSEWIRFKTAGNVDYGILSYEAQQNNVNINKSHPCTKYIMQYILRYRPIEHRYHTFCSHKAKYLMGLKFSDIFTRLIPFGF